jgi:hypothetical protein
MVLYAKVLLGRAGCCCDALPAGRERLEEMGHLLQDGSDECITDINTTLPCLIHYRFVN